MATQPLDTAKVYALTAAGACSVTLTQGEKSITWEALSEGGQTSFIVPAGATAEISDTSALLSPLPANFKAALGAGTSRAGGERMVTYSDGLPSIPMQHAVWCELPSTTTTVEVRPAPESYRALSMQLLLTPDDNMSKGWLSVPTGGSLVWLYGEPTIVGGNSTHYIIGLTQVTPGTILANLLATY